MKSPGYGIAGGLASAFLDSKIAPLLMIAALLLGVMAVIKTPREEEPQIVVPFADVLVSLPGATPAEVEDRVTRPLERMFLELPGVRHVYATSLPDLALLTVRFRVGEDQERSLVKIYDALAGGLDRMPPGASPPLVKARLIDDVPILNLVLWEEQGDPLLLRDVAAAVEEEIHTVPDVSVTRLIGGHRRTLEIRLDPRALAAAGIPPHRVTESLRAVNVASSNGSLVSAGERVLVRTDAFLETAEDVASVVVGVVDDRPVRLRSVATIREVSESEDYVSFMGGAAVEVNQPHGVPGRSAPAVTISVAKRKGADATRVAEAVQHRLAEVQARLFPETVHLTVARDSGETADEKATDLLKHLLGAVISVTVVIALAMGLRGSSVVLITVPITFALTLFTYYMFGYTLNRVTLFALIFVTGIVVDDSIIIVENIYRHLRMKVGGNTRSTLLGAVAEVGNPTVLATLTVIASVLPMAFVGGLMGPYMKPMPIGAALAMTFSLLVALTIAPYLSKRLLKSPPEGEGDTEMEETAPPRLRRIYGAILKPLLDRPRRGVATLAGAAVLLVASVMLIPLKAVSVKMLPFDNKSEIQVLVDMPEGATLEATSAAANEIAAALSEIPEVTDLQVYAGTASPITFNGLIRHYDLRRGPDIADIQVNLKPKKDRSRKSHALAKVIRDRALPAAERHGAVIKVVEVPPGPPVLSTLVAEIYGPDLESRVELADQVKRIMEDTPGIVDVDWMIEAPQIQWQLRVDRTRSAMAGVSPATVADAVDLALNGRQVGVLHPPHALEPVPMVVRWPQADRTSVAALADMRLPSDAGTLVPAAAVMTPIDGDREVSLHRKDARSLVYVVAEVSGGKDSPVYSMLDMRDRVDALTGSRGEPVRQLFQAYPQSRDEFAVRWDGEWEITRDVFRDLGIAFGVVLILIYMLIAGWFQDLKKPLVMMAAIPLSLIGIIPGHYVFDGFFTATSMIGLIALAGIMVRNGVLLIDFVGLARARGLALDEALLEAGAVRLRPIALTAGTVVVGAFVILFDPIFQGLAISLMAGSIASTVLTLVVVPVLYYLTERGKEEARA